MCVRVFGSVRSHTACSLQRNRMELRCENKTGYFCKIRFEKFNDMILSENRNSNALAFQSSLMCTTVTEIAIETRPGILVTDV